MSGSLAGGSSKSYQQQQASGFSQSEQAAVSSSSSTQNIAFEDLFANLYGNASGAAGRAVAGANDLGTAAFQLFTGGNQFLESLGNDAGSEYLKDRLNANNPVIEQQIADLQRDTGRFFNEELNPAITSRAVAGGTYGGGRQGIAQGLAAERAAQAFTQGATALRAEDVKSRDAVAQSIATNTLSAASTGIGSLPTLLDTLQRGNRSELGIYADLASILGGPTTLTTSESLAQSLAKAYGENQSSGYGRSSAWNFDTAYSTFGSA